jgi:predicted  nucleic acid-binding Zn-ribbon protein
VLELEIQKLNIKLNGGEGITGDRNRKAAVVQEIDAIEKELKSRQASIEELQTSHALEQVKEMLDKTKSSLEDIEKEQKNLEDFNLINQEIVDLKQEVQVLEQGIVKLNKHRRNLAIIIKTQWDSAKLLREFADHVCGGATDSEEKITDGKHLNATIQTCQQFIELFDKHKNTLLGDIRSEFGF